ncbi:MAG TPA: glycosyltransferase family 2 protein [Pilimelia sp.]|nr:glycosyltransferase family 2 protein [Pilimelia sp.]
MVSTIGKKPELSVSVVVPCYRSAATLPELVDRLLGVLPAATAAYEVILVVDGSPDGTWQVAEELARRHPPVRAVRLARNYGQHNALVAGIRAARHEAVVTMDDDLQHPPEEVPALLAALTDDIDLVYGVPRREEHGLLRSAASRLVKASLASAMGVRDARLVGAFRAFRTFLRAGLAGVHGPHVTVDVALSWGTTRVTGAAVRMDERRHGRSGYTFGTLVRHALNMTLGYSVAPLRLVTCLGFLVGAAGLALFVRVLLLYFRGDTTIAGFTTVASMVALFSSAQLVAIGVLGEYVGRIHAQGIGRPTYVVREAVGPPDPAGDLPAARRPVGAGTTG